MKFYFVHIVKACFVFKKHHAYAYICLYMQKNNRKLNFRKNHWASLFAHRQLKTLKYSIPLTHLGECPKSKVTPLHKTLFFKVQLCPFHHFSCAKPCNFVCDTWDPFPSHFCYVIAFRAYKSISFYYTRKMIKGTQLNFNAVFNVYCSGVTLLFGHSPSWVSGIQHSEIFSVLWENKLAQWFFAKFNFLLFFRIYRPI